MCLFLGNNCIFQVSIREARQSDNERVIYVFIMPFSNTAYTRIYKGPFRYICENRGLLSMASTCIKIFTGK